MNELEKILKESKFGYKTLNESEIVEILDDIKDKIDTYFNENLTDKNDAEQVKRFKFRIKNALNSDYYVRNLDKEKIEELRNIIAEEYLK